MAGPGGPELDHLVVSERGGPHRSGAEPKRAAGQTCTEPEIRRKEALLHAVLDTVGVGVAVVGPEGQPLLQNAAFRAVLRHAAPGSREDAVESELLVFGPDGTTPIPPEKRLLPRLSQGTSFSEELIWIGPEDDRRAISVSGQAARTDAFEGSVVAFDDITRLATALAARDNFINTVSHELRTPLTSVIGYLELALDEDLPAQLRRSLDAALRNSERLLRLVTDLLDAARGEPTPEKQEADLARIITTRIQAITPRAEARNIRIVSELPQTLPACIDPAGIARMLDNLLSNAVKFSFTGDKVTVRARRQAGNILIEVTDTGMGMSEHEQREAFARFFRSTTAARAAIPGAGLGLKIAKAIVEAHNGSITVTSTPARGSTFTVVLPVGRQRPGAISPEHASIACSPRSRGKVVD